jgi:hypothetical protein
LADFAWARAAAMMVLADERVRVMFWIPSERILILQI